MSDPDQTLRNFFQYCPHCGTRFKTKKVHGEWRLVCPSCSFTFFQNSKPTASVFFVRKKNVLLARRGITPLNNWWDAPGGFLNLHETPEAGAKREMREELGVSPLDLEFLDIYLGWYRRTPLQSTFNVYYVCRRWRGRFVASDDISAYRWFPLARLPKRIAFTNNRQALRELKRVSLIRVRVR